jgi:hypothetical protein
MRNSDNSAGKISRQEVGGRGGGKKGGTEREGQRERAIACITGCYEASCNISSKQPFRRLK